MKAIIIFFPLICLILNGCAAVRLGGRIYQGTGDAMVKSADEEEAKRAKKKSEQQNTASSKSNKAQKEEKTGNKRAIENETKIVTIKKNYTTVNVRSEPSTKKSPVAKLTGGDKVEKIGQSGDWLKIRFNIEGNQGEGWISKDLVEN